MKKAVVITTINEPTEAILKFCDKKDWEIIVVGDVQTPHEKYRNLSSNLFYMDCQYQEDKYKELSEVIGWRQSPRRNLGFVEAYKRGNEIIALSDDDNIPYDTWGEDLIIGKEIDALCCTPIDCQVFDPLSATSIPHLWHRGFPLEYIQKRKFSSKNIKMTPKIQVDLWDGNPDIDAVGRLIYPHEDIKIEIPMPYCSTVIAPFDSQNTFIHRDLISSFLLLPGVGRIDDIWGSYYLQQTNKSETPYIVYNKPSVWQTRNQHSLIKDFELENWGTNNVVKFLNGEDVLPQQAKDTIEIYKKAFIE